MPKIMITLFTARMINLPSFLVRKKNKDIKRKLQKKDLSVKLHSDTMAQVSIRYFKSYSKNTH